MASDPSSSKDNIAPTPDVANNTFLFINESTHKAGKKIGRRTDIKSHVRNHIVRLKSRQKDGQSTASETATNEVGLTDNSRSSKGKSKENDSAENHRTDQTGVPFQEWSRPPHSRWAPNEGGSISSISQESISQEVPIPPPTPELGWYQDHRPSDQSQIPSIPLPKPNVVSDVLERAITLTIRNPLEPQRLYQEQGYLKESRDIFIPGDYGGSPEVGGYDAMRSVHEANCAVCRSPQRFWKKCDEHGGAWKGKGKAAREKGYDDGEFKQAAIEAIKRQECRSRPLDQLGKLGHGRVDPFSSYPTLVDDPNGSLHELVDHSVTYLLPGLLADGATDTPSNITTAWMSSGLKSPLLFHALVFAGSIHLSYLRTSTIHPNSTLSLTHKLAVIHQLNKVLSSPTERIRDEIILAILILSSHEVMDLTVAEEMCFDSPLKRMQWLNIYGSIRNVQEHLKAVMDLVTLRGGVESLELYGLAEILLAGDVVAAATSLSKPTFQPLKRSIKWVIDVVCWARSPPRLPCMILGSAFKQYILHGLTPEVIELFDAISAVTMAIEHHLSGESRGLTLTAIARTRTTCQLRLLSLSTASEIFEMPEEAPYVYEAVRLTANIYAIGVIFPIPRSSAVLQTLVQKLAAAIEEAELERYGNLIPDLLLWILVLGGIAALHKPERSWYVDRLVTFSRVWDVVKWSDVKAVLVRFLWLDSACGASGRKLWSLVAERRAYLETNQWLASSP